MMGLLRGIASQQWDIVDREECQIPAREYVMNSRIDNDLRARRSDRGNVRGTTRGMNSGIVPGLSLGPAHPDLQRDAALRSVAGRSPPGTTGAGAGPGVVLTLCCWGRRGMALLEVEGPRRAAVVELTRGRFPVVIHL